MGFDIRFPIGMMFTLFGALLGVYGIFTRGSEMYARHSLGINMNIWWGLAMLIFGTSMLLLARGGEGNRRSAGKSAETKSTNSIPL